MFHLFTHAFFKALLFLSAGSVIHGLHHEQDMRFMGGVRKKMKITYAMMLIGTLALIGAGIPGTQIGFAGFFSKDAAIEAAYGASLSGRMGGQAAFWAGIIAALMTSFYSWRLLFMTFEGTFRPNPHAHGHGHDEEGSPEPDTHAHAANDAHGHDDHHHTPAAPGVAPAHESPWIMLGPLVVLAAGAVFAGFFFAPYFIGEHAHEFWREAVVLPAHEEGHHVPTWVMWAPAVVTITGFLLALPIYLFSQTMGAKLAKAFGPVHAFLYHKWFFDEIYDFIFVKGARALGGFFWKIGDQKVIDGLGPNGVAAVAKFSARQVRKVQTGYVYHYSFLMLAGIIGFGAFALWWAGAIR
jgi:NADH-quinone oxidoreductase subunit L